MGVGVIGQWRGPILFAIVCDVRVTERTVKRVERLIETHWAIARPGPPADAIGRTRSLRTSVAATPEPPTRAGTLKWTLLQSFQSP